MGFWDVTKRLLTGKTAFETPPATDDWDDDAPTVDYAEDRQAKQDQAQAGTARETDDDLYDDSGVKHIPRVEVTNTRSKPSGDRFELWLTIRNQSDRDVMLDKITLLGTRRELDYPLRPHDQRVFSVYSGPQLKHDSYKKAELYYKDAPTGDYFRADHLIEYTYESEGYYEIVDMEPIMPIRDV